MEFKWPEPVGPRLKLATSRYWIDGHVVAIVDGDGFQTHEVLKLNGRWYNTKSRRRAKLPRGAKAMQIGTTFGNMRVKDIRPFFKEAKYVECPLCGQEVDSEDRHKLEDY